MAENPYESPKSCDEPVKHSSNPPEPYGSYWEYFRDVGLGFLIMMGGIVLAGIIAAPFHDLTDYAYPAALCLGLAPFFWFTRQCRIHDYDFYDYAAGSFLIVFIATPIQSALRGTKMGWMEIPLVVMVIGGFFRFWKRIRRWAWPREDRSPDV